MQADDFLPEHVERFLSPLGRGAGIAENAAAIAERMAGSIDGVAQAPLLADFGEEPRAHAVGEDADGPAKLEVFEVAVRRSVEGDRQMNLL